MNLTRVGGQWRRLTAEGHGLAECAAVEESILSPEESWLELHGGIAKLISLIIPHQFFLGVLRKKRKENGKQILAICDSR